MDRRFVFTPRSFIPVYIYLRGGRAPRGEVVKAYEEAARRRLAYPMPRGELEKWLRWHVVSGNIRESGGVLLLDDTLPPRVRRLLEERTALLGKALAGGRG